MGEGRGREGEADGGNKTNKEEDNNEKQDKKSERGMSKAIDAVVAQLLRAAVTPANTQINEIPENEVDAYVAQMLKAEKTAESTNNVQQKKKKEMRMNDTSYELLEYEYATERIA